MALAIHEDDSKIDPNISCTKCEAVCCRLTVVIADSDRVAEHLTTHSENGIKIMAHGEDGWCVALDRVNRNCGIYTTRPDVCRRFAMGAGYCRLERENFADAIAAGKIPLRLV